MTELWARRRTSRVIFLEITDRPEPGEDLYAPQLAEGGRDRYGLISQTQQGDTVLHYHQPSDGIVGISRVVGGRQHDTIRWAAKGTSARSQHTKPYLRPAWLVPLGGYTSLDPPVLQEEIIAKRADIFRLRDRLEAQHGPGLHYPYYRYGTDQLRTLQAYMAVFPRELLQLLPALKAQVTAFERLSDDQLPDRPDDPAEPALYLANEQITVNRSGKVEIDAEALTRANRSHARLQNLLRNRVLRAGKTMLPVPSANVDLAWRAGTRGHSVIAEVKSLTPDNEEHQLRYGLGQLVDYLDALDNDGDGHRPIGVLFIARAPRRLTWLRKCDRVGIELCWPGRWPQGL
jgi:hypothetical protein